MQNTTHAARIEQLENRLGDTIKAYSQKNLLLFVREKYSADMFNVLKIEEHSLLCVPLANIAYEKLESIDSGSCGAVFRSRRMLPETCLSRNSEERTIDRRLLCAVKLLYLKDLNEKVTGNTVRKVMKEMSLNSRLSTASAFYSIMAAIEIDCVPWQ